MTFGLVVLIFALVRAGRAALAPFAVGAYIAAGLLVVVVDEFRQPMIDVARTLGDLRRHRPGVGADVLLVQLLGGAVAVAIVALLYPHVPRVADAVVVPHDGTKEFP